MLRDSIGRFMKEPVIPIKEKYYQYKCPHIHVMFYTYHTLMGNIFTCSTCKSVLFNHIKHYEE